MATVYEVVEGSGAEHEVALQHEVPEYRHHYRGQYTRYCEAYIVDHVDRVEQMAAVEQISEILRAECVEQQTAEPHQEKFDAYGEI